VIRVWGLATGETVRVLRGQVEPGTFGRLNGAAVGPDGRWLAAGGYAPGDRGPAPILLFDLATNAVARVLPGHVGNFIALAFSPDGAWLAAAGQEGSLWPPSTPKHAVPSVVTLPSGEWVDPQTGQQWPLRRLYVNNREERATVRKVRAQQRARAEAEFTKVRAGLGKRQSKSAAQVEACVEQALKARRVWGLYRVGVTGEGKRLELTWEVDAEAPSRAEALDGSYVLLCSLPVERTESSELLRRYICRRGSTACWSERPDGSWRCKGGRSWRSCWQGMWQRCPRERISWERSSSCI
jgi:hypothetical protein